MHWFYDPSIKADSVSITAEELVHFKALRIEPGEQIAISSGVGIGFLAKVVDPKLGSIQILQEVETTRRPNVHLFQAIAKGGRDESALQACVELGISGVTAFEAERSVANWSAKSDKGISRWQQIAVSATKQSQQLWLPTVDYQPNSELVPIGRGLVLDPRAGRGISQVELADQFSVAVGPEGGFSESELRRLEENGFEPVRLGRSVLRTSTAGVVAIAALQLITGEYGGRLG